MIALIWCMLFAVLLQFHVIRYALRAYSYSNSHNQLRVLLVQLLSKTTPDDGSKGFHVTVQHGSVVINFLNWSRIGLRAESLLVSYHFSRQTDIIRCFACSSKELIGNKSKRSRFPGGKNLDHYMIQWKFIFDASRSSNENLSHL